MPAPASFRGTQSSLASMTIGAPLTPFRSLRRLHKRHQPPRDEHADIDAARTMAPTDQEPSCRRPSARRSVCSLGFLPLTLSTEELAMRNNLRIVMFTASLVALVTGTPARGQSLVPDLEQEIRQRAAQIEDKLIAWRRDIHQNPELGEQETRTSKLVAEHLVKLGLEVKTGVARTGVVALLKGGKPGPVVMLRADMD